MWGNGGGDEHQGNIEKYGVFPWLFVSIYLCPSGALHYRGDFFSIYPLSVEAEDLRRRLPGAPGGVIWFEPHRSGLRLLQEQAKAQRAQWAGKLQGK